MVALGRLEGKVESLLSMQRTHAEDIEKLDKRIRDLEHSKSWLMGAAAIIGAGASMLVSLVKGNFS
tara:strand:- start:541 stop:738 length:198 start_codon:yes stop_codon:yes gene_type:complete